MIVPLATNYTGRLKRNKFSDTVIVLLSLVLVLLFITCLIPGKAMDVAKGTSPLVKRTGQRNGPIIYLVPNIVHFVWFGRTEWKFHQMLSVKSAFINIKPDKILFHCDQEPFGKWWNYTKEQVPVLNIVKALVPTKIFGNKITLMEHKSDVYRFQILLKMGGIYLDTDVIALKSFDPLRRYEFTLGLELPMHLGNDVIISAKNATFLNIWYKAYKTFSYREYNVHSVLVPYILSLQYPHLIHVEPYSINYPDWSTKGLDLLYRKHYDWTNNYSVHMNYRYNKIDYTPSIIRTLNSTFGQIARFIYYGESKILNN